MGTLGSIHVGSDRFFIQHQLESGAHMDPESRFSPLVDKIRPRDPQTRANPSKDSRRSASGFGPTLAANPATKDRAGFEIKGFLLHLAAGLPAGVTLGASHVRTDRFSGQHQLCPGPLKKGVLQDGARAKEA